MTTNFSFLKVTWLSFLWLVQGKSRRETFPPAKNFRIQIHLEICPCNIQMCQLGHGPSHTTGLGVSLILLYGASLLCEILIYAILFCQKRIDSWCFVPENLQEFILSTAPDHTVFLSDFMLWYSIRIAVERYQILSNYAQNCRIIDLCKNKLF